MKKIFDNFIDAVLHNDTVRQTKIEIEELIKKNSEIPLKCGSCNKWMTSGCRRESHHKVSCNEQKCSTFTMQKWSVDLIKKNEEKINNLKAKINAL